MADAIASPLARRVYDRVNDATTHGIRAASQAAQGVASADNADLKGAIQAWNTIEEKLHEQIIACAVAMAQVVSARREVQSELKTRALKEAEGG